MDDLLSIIVPVYNMEKYVGDCIKSILNQSYKNLECIIVDDGSTDGSGEICDRYAEEDSRVRVYHQNNGGVSKARNVGLHHITGRYLAFVDSDDVLLPEMYSIMVNELIKNDADEVSCNWTNTNENLESDPGIIVASPGPLTFFGIRSFSEIFETFMKDGDSCATGAGVLWNKVYDYKKIKNKIETKIFFDEDIYLCEDILWLCRLHTLCEGKSVILDQQLYFYRQHMNHYQQFRDSHKMFHRRANHIIANERMLDIAYKIKGFDRSTLRKTERCLATECWSFLWEIRTILNEEHKEEVEYVWNCYHKYGPRNIRDFKERIKHPIKYLFLRRLVEQI